MPPSFELDESQTIETGDGKRSHRAHNEHSQRLQRKLITVGDHAWCLIGNGLSNQSFINAPDGIIAIDSGESIEEMAAALVELRRVTDQPIIGVLYTHFHYVQGTAAIFNECRDRNRAEMPPIYGDERIDANRLRAATEIAPAYGRGIAEQFGTMMPDSGPDGLVNVGLGLAYRMREHAPFTNGYISPTHPLRGSSTFHLGGLEIQVEPAPSDSDDSVTYWFPTLGLAVHNLIWPTLFNIFAIRGEEYRDPRILLRGIDHILSLRADHLVATHGPPMSGAEEIRDRVTKYRDSIQFLWDQTVRWSNRGVTADELAYRVVLPALFDEDFLTRQLYGVAEHHVRQIRSGLFGWFDGDPQNLFRMAPEIRSAQFIKAMGGRDATRLLCQKAADDDLRWALELATLLSVGEEAELPDRELLASVLRKIAYRTTSANIRNWCITRALDIDGEIDMTRMRTHRFYRKQVATWPTSMTVHVLRVLVEPERLDDIDVHVAWLIDNERTGLHFRNFVACPTDGRDADGTVSCTKETWADVLAEKQSFTDAVASGKIIITGKTEEVERALLAIDHPSFRPVT